ncbi:glycosyltransferase family 2 protein [Erythrobacter litoralis]|uniref:glycosyltransferase family 2 protein n=1 Tax=Erythrobacter litoralis TaxID=39960 RepID=UPI00243606A7|nr:glycosyltransferase family 2 protein [Erythrobacter litoralis]MDG6079079.1 glycosyltransferase family 2 protein [Erythrobacter litoralis]
MPDQTCDISVIVPHYQDLAHLDQCLDALTAQTELGGQTFEVIVADNNSACGLDEVRRVVAGRGRVILARDQGAGPARNAGVAEAKGTILAFTDSDCVPVPQWLSKGVAALRNYDLVGGRVITSVTRPRGMNGIEAFERVFAFDNESYIRTKGFTGSGNLFCTAETFAKVGPFKTVVSEDREWSIRATSKGFALGYEAEAIVEHPARETWTDLTAKWRRINRETYAFERQNGGSNLRWIFRTWLLPASIVPHSLKAVRSDALVDVGDRIRAIGMLAKQRFWRFYDAHRLLFERTR